ncbi:hypothetical protein PAMA_012236 [Pampus argenteus]
MAWLSLERPARRVAGEKEEEEMICKIVLSVSPVKVCAPSTVLSAPRLLTGRDDVPPYFKTEPVRSQLHLERNRLVLTCMAEGSWPLEFKWIHNNTELTRFSLEYR